MSRIFTIVGKMFTKLFVQDYSVLSMIIYNIVNPVRPYLFIGLIFVFIGFAVGILKRIIHS